VVSRSVVANLRHTPSRFKETKPIPSSSSSINLSFICLLFTRNILHNCR
jgi:hypothetical protein